MAGEGGACERIRTTDRPLTGSLRPSRPTAVYLVLAGFLVAEVLLNVPQFRSVLARERHVGSGTRQPSRRSAGSAQHCCRHAGYGVQDCRHCDHHAHLQPAELRLNLHKRLLRRRFELVVIQVTNCDVAAKHEKRQQRETRQRRAQPTDQPLDNYITKASISSSDGTCQGSPQALLAGSRRPPQFQGGTLGSALLPKPDRCHLREFPRLAAVASLRFPAS